MPYRIETPYSGSRAIIDTEDGERVARVATFMPGPMVLVEGARIMSPGLARIVAAAMIDVAEEIGAG